MDSCFSEFDIDPPTSKARVEGDCQSKLPARETSIAVRRACSQDLNDLAEVLARSFHPSIGLMAWAYPILKLGIHEDLRSRLQEGSTQYICLAAVLSSHGTKENPTASRPKVAGTVELAVRSSIFPGGPRYAYISNLAVSPFYRRQGIARKLLSSCEPAARAWGFREIYLHVLEDNDRARKLYTSSGYRLHRVESNLFGAWLNRPRRLLLHKPLMIDN